MGSGPIVLNGEDMAVAEIKGSGSGGITITISDGLSERKAAASY